MFQPRSAKGFSCLDRDAGAVEVLELARVQSANEVEAVSFEPCHNQTVVIDSAHNFLRLTLSNDFRL